MSSEVPRDDEVGPSEEHLLFASQVRAARAALGWSQAELAAKAGIGKRSLIRIEQGSRDVRRSSALAVEQAFARVGLRFEHGPAGGFKLLVPAASVLPEH